MNVGKISYYSRKIHRFLVLLMVIIGFFMMSTGLTMKYPEISPFNPKQARILHNALSNYFALILAVMMLTGLIMYITPWLLKRFRKDNITN